MQERRQKINILNDFIESTEAILKAGGTLTLIIGTGNQRFMKNFKRDDFKGPNNPEPQNPIIDTLVSHPGEEVCFCLKDSNNRRVTSFSGKIKY